MGLDNIPDPYPCSGKETTIRTRNDQLDCEAMREKRICPAVNLDPSLDMFGTYCWLRGKVIAHELEALGKTSLAYEFYEEKSPDEVTELLISVREVYEEVKKSNGQEKDSLKGACRIRTYKNGSLVQETYDGYKEILTELEDTIKWLEMLQQNECGFKAWY